jgi:hypothetical protein
VEVVLAGRRRRRTDGDQICGVKPLVCERDASCIDDLVSQRNRPEMLDQHDGSTAARRNRVGEVPHLCLIEDVAVLALERSGDESGRSLFLAVGTEANEGADRGPELNRLVGRQIARLDYFELAVLAFRHEEEVDHPHRADVFEPVELRHDLALESGSIEL